MQILEDRLTEIVALPLSSGGHNSLDDGCCVMEAAAYIAGENWSDHPQCVCPVIAAFLRSWNDSLPSDAERNRLLKPLLPIIIGTRTGPELELTRAMLVVDWFLRDWLPVWLELTPACSEACSEVAALLRNAKPIQQWEDFDEIIPSVRRADSEASAAENAAWNAAVSAARNAAESATRIAAWSAARNAAESAAESATRSAAWSAAESAAESALSPVVNQLQLSAVALVERMAGVK